MELAPEQRGRRHGSARKECLRGAGNPKAHLHDLVSTDRRNPTVNANGPVYGVLEASADYMPVLDPHAVSRVRLRSVTPTHRRTGRAADRTIVTTHATPEEIE